jgi:hypothetical protein
VKRRTASAASPEADTGTPSRRSPVALVKAVFTQHLRMQRSERGIEIVMGRSEPSPKPAMRDDEERAMQAELAMLLDAQPGSRKVLRALAIVEHQLRRRGSALFIHEMKLPALQLTLRQLDSIAPRPGRGLSALRVRLQDALSLRERLAREAQMRQPLSSLLGQDKLQVDEVPISDFMRAATQPAAR